MSTVVQPCARCGARWGVQGAPMHWCPRCRGVLLSPGPIDGPPERRNYRWVARRPDHRNRPAHSASVASPTRTPAYDHMPTWGLADRPPAPAAPRPRRFAGFGARVHTLLILTATMFGLAGLSELLRYGILLRNRTRLIDPWLLRLSDALVTASSTLAMAAGFAAAIAAVVWLIDTRAAAYARAGHRDPRAPRTLALGSLIPVINLLWPGVFLTELARTAADPRALRAVRIWWCAWLAGGALVAAALLWRTADSLQAKADGVLFTAFTDIWAATLAVLTLWVLRYLDGRNLLGGTRTERRWVVAAEPVAPVIEPVHPGHVADEAAAGEEESTARTAAARTAAARNAATEDIAEDRDTGNAVDRKHEEVMAK
ncbi:DUF4328 domain-containing protein [Nocardia arizonensis]|uniref:DUF4328 domain-containing protein n=1 Tax=Nocardia arizonensis TaxID=1141647 RepID=UPI0006D25771|nr:DUF4328 domain-containing protein [Nocardia arizonensis]